MMNEKKYKIMRFSQKSAPRRVRGYPLLTLEEARRVCSDPETSSETAVNACNNNEKTIEKWHEKQKHWFYGFVSV